MPITAYVTDTTTVTACAAKTTKSGCLGVLDANNNPKCTFEQNSCVKQESSTGSRTFEKKWAQASEDKYECLFGEVIDTVDSVDSVASCKSVCASHRNCLLVTYKTSVQECKLLSSCSTRGKDTDRVTYERIPEDVSRAGFKCQDASRIKAVSTASESIRSRTSYACRLACLAEPVCRWAHFDRGNCILYRADVPTPVAVLSDSSEGRNFYSLHFAALNADKKLNCAEDEFCQGTNVIYFLSLSTATVFYI